MDVTLAGSALVYLPSDDELSRVSVELAAFDGEVGNGILPVPDRAAAINVAGGRRALITEGAVVLSDGFVVDHDRTRGPIPAGTARVYSFGLQDANALLDGFRVERTWDGGTDVALVLAFAAEDFPAWDTTWVVNANTVTIPAKTYASDGGWTSEVIPDLIESTGKTLFVHDLADGSGRCLHYHILTSGHTCGLAISDVIAAQDATTFYPWSPQWTGTSVDLVNDVKGTDQSGRISEATDSASITAHDADGLLHQSLQDFEAVSQADLDVKTAAFLASQKDERDTWTCQIGPLDETALALIRPGDLIPATSTVMGLTASPQRIAHMTLTPYIGEGGRASPGWWMAALELGAPIRRRARVANKATVDRVKHRPLPDPDNVLVCVPVGLYGDWSAFNTTPPSAPFDPTPLEGGAEDNDVSWTPTAGTIAFADDTFFENLSELAVVDGPPYLFSSLKCDIAAGVVVADTVDGDLVSCQYTLKIDYGITTQHVRVDLIFEHLGQTYAPDAWRAATELPDGWTVGTAYVPGDVVYHKAAGQHWWECTTPNTAIEPGVTGGYGTYWTATMATLSDQMDWEFELDYAGQCRVWPHIGSRPTLANYPATVTGSTGVDVTYVNVQLDAPPNSDPAVDVTFLSTWSVDNLALCAYVPAAVGYHWTHYGPAAPQETPDGSTSTFTIPAYPPGGYVRGSLTVSVDGVPQNVTEVDPATGTFALSWAPTSDNAIRCTWLVP